MRSPTNTLEASPAQPSPPVEDQTSTGALCCRHCGTPCPEGSPRDNEFSFCCHGCQTVFHLLKDHGLADYYAIDPDAKIPIPEVSQEERYRYLDSPEAREKLLDFHDGKTARIRFQIPAIHCAACVWLLENLYQIDPRIGEARVNLLTKELQVTFDEDSMALSELVERLHGLGYPPHLQLDSLDPDSQSAAPMSRLTLQIGIAGFCFGNIMLLSFPHYLGLSANESGQYDFVLRFLPFLLSLPVITFCASDYWKGAWQNLKHRRVSIEVPIVLGIIALVTQSSYQSLFGAESGYWDSLAGLIFFLLCGRVFKERALDHLSFDQDYRSFFPLSILRQTDDEYQPVAISDLKTGDRIRIRNGEIVPADGTLISENSLIDYSFVTGESDPTPLSAGQKLLAGGRNIGPAFDVETTKPVSESYLTSLWNHHVFDSDQAAGFTNLTDRVSQYFTFTVILLALLAAAYWAVVEPSNALHVFTSVLIVACPCALALAAPFATGTAMRVLGTRFVHLKDANCIERIARISTIVFDKTGTLTRSRAQQTRFHGPPLSPSEQSLIKTVAQQSTHPLSMNLAEHLPANSSDLPITRFEEIAGSGIAALIQGHEVIYGSQAWLVERDINVEGSAPQSGSLVHLGIDGQFRGTFQIQPSLRPQITDLVAQLMSNYRVELASGDSNRDEDTLRSVFGKNAKMSFDQSPYSKLRLIEKLQSNQERVMFVGDGLNDAGALKQADVGIAITENTGHFTPASDVIVNAEQLSRLASVLTFSKMTVQVIWLSFMLSFAYNIVGISLAASGHLSPLVAAILMPLSSVTIVAFSTMGTSWLAHRTELAFTPNQETLPR